MGVPGVVENRHKRVEKHGPIPSAEAMRVRRAYKKTSFHFLFISIAALLPLIEIHYM